MNILISGLIQRMTVMNVSGKRLIQTRNLKRKRVKMMDEIYNNQLTGKLIGCGKHRGFKYYIVTFGTHPCAYISIHPGNDLHGVDL